MGYKVLFVAVAIITICRTHGQFSGTWQKAPTERATSIALDRMKGIAYITYIDLSKENGTNGLIKAIDTDISSNSTVYDPQLPSLRLPVDALPPISPTAIRTDKCNNLWILDSAVQNITGHQTKAQPSLQAFNLKYQQVLIKYAIPQNQIAPESYLTTMVLDTIDKCESSNVYIADFNRPAIIAYNSKQQASKLFKHHYFNPDPLIKVPDEIIFSKKHRDVSGIFGVAVINSNLYFHPLASHHEFLIKIELLRSSEKISYQDIAIAFDRPTIAGATAYDPTTNTTFFAQLDGIGCMGPKGIFITLAPSLPKAFVSDLAINGTALWLLMNANDRFYVEQRNIKELISGSACDSDVSHRYDPDHFTGNSSGSIIFSSVTIFIAMEFFTLRIFF